MSDETQAPLPQYHPLPNPKGIPIGDPQMAGKLMKMIKQVGHIHAGSRKGLTARQTVHIARRRKTKFY